MPLERQHTFDWNAEQLGVILVSPGTESDLQNSILREFLEESISEDFEILRTAGLPSKKIILVNPNKLSDRAKRKEVYSRLADLKGDFVVRLDTFPKEDASLEDLLITFLTKHHRIQDFKSKKEENKRNYRFFCDDPTWTKIQEAEIVANAINQAKDWVNTPYNSLNAETFANKALTLRNLENVQVEVLHKAEIEQLGMGLFLGVNAGSYDEPKLIFVRYQGKETMEDPIALIGKGVMFDTGGYSLKTAQSMPGMKGDMAGAAAVISAVEAIAKLKLPVNLYAIVAATDNRLGEHAIVPDDILTSAKGLTVEIVSTDAEGRLTLADAMWYAQQKGAKKLIDVATLTGAMVAALGDYHTGAFTNDSAFLSTFKEATLRADEPIWEMPVGAPHHKEIKSNVADLKNKGGRNAGASSAAAFLEEFVEKGVSWIHLDIAGTSTSGELATGVMVRSFVEFFQSK